jgi:hypothetical protein
MNVFDHGVEAPERPDVRAVGALVAASLSIIIALVGWLLVPDVGWILGIAGIPGTTVVAWRLAPRATVGGTRRAIRVAGELALFSILVADALITGLLLAWTVIGALTAGAPTAPTDILIGVVGLALYFIGVFAIGAVFYGLAASVVVVPAALTWVVIVRRIAHPI